MGILLLLIATGCGGGSTNAGSGSSGGSGGSSGGSGGGSQGGGGATAPAITQFGVTPAIAAGGQLVNFSWTTTNATAFTVTPSILLEDTTTLAVNNPKYAWGAPSSTTTYQAQATGAAGTTPAAASVNLTVVPVTLSASATQIPAGQSVMLTYSGPNNGSQYVLTALPANTQTTLSPGCSGSTCTGTQMVGPLSTNVGYTVTANGPVGGQSVSPTVNITVTGAMTLTFSANPQTVQSGGASTLSWMTTNAVSVSIDNGIGNVTPVGSGTYVVHPTQTTTYTATATDVYSNQIQASATVTVSTGGVSNLNHIIYMVQENRAFDNYFGSAGAVPRQSSAADPGRAAERRERSAHSAAGVHHQESGRELLWAVPSAHRVHREPVAIVGRDALRHGPGGQRLVEPDAEFAVPDGPFPVHHAVRRNGRSVRSQPHASAGILRSDGPAVLLRAGDAVRYRRQLVLADSSEHHSEPHVPVRGNIVWSRVSRRAIPTIRRGSGQPSSAR